MVNPFSTLKFLIFSAHFIDVNTTKAFLYFNLNQL
ncbi:hypothetical protein FLAT13_03387 [Flavobacterium salmonis]|uniref:Uncharacterized protein n=1 Tax=Flavobacterium salmonis TaxID=2654844 RepID=A0A6V6Z4B6_9FLAO|nr:hypothetical protein FLAT13_03387 [Flavobacterium salmonis]